MLKADLEGAVGCLHELEVGALRVLCIMRRVGKQIRHAAGQGGKGPGRVIRVTVALRL